MTNGKLLPFVTYYGYCHSLDGATLFSKVDSNKLRINIKNKMTLIDAQFDADLIIIHAEHVVHRRGYCFHFGCMYVCMYVSALERKRLIGMT